MSDKKLVKILFIVFIFAIVGFFSAIISVHSLVFNKGINRVHLSNLYDSENKKTFKYRVLTIEDRKNATFQTEIDKNELVKIDDENQPLQLIMYRIACNWYKVYFNDVLIGTHGNVCKDNSIVWNTLARFDIDQKLISSSNTVKIEIFGQYEMGALSFAPIITNMSSSMRIMNLLEMLQSFYILAIGVLIFCFIILILLSMLVEKKNIIFVCYGLAALFSSLYILDNILIYNLAINLLLFKKFIFLSLYASIATFSLAIYFHFKEKVSLYTSVCLYFFSLLLILISTNMIVLRNLANITNIIVVFNIFGWIYVTIKVWKKYNHAKIICIASIFLFLTTIYDVFFILGNLQTDYNILSVNIYGAWFFSLAIILMIITEYIYLNGLVFFERNNAKLLYDISIHDPMTKAFNYQYTLSILEKNTKPYSIIMIDTDHFKQINDTYGHDVGDEIIQFVVSKCNRAATPDDVVCRRGGDEFLIAVLNPEAKQALETANYLMELIQQPIRLKSGDQLTVTLSIGVYYNYEIEKNTADIAIKYADQALYVSKEQGRNRVTYHSDAVKKNLIPKEMRI